MTDFIRLSLPSSGGRAPEKPFECKVCHKKFAESGNLRTHQKKHVNALPNSKVKDNTFSAAAQIATSVSWEVDQDEHDDDDDHHDCSDHEHDCSHHEHDHS